MKVENGTSSILYAFNEFGLEQQDAEIRKPLEDEIERLHLSIKNQPKRLVLLPLPEGEYVLHYLNNDRIKKQTKQEVLAELLEWVESNITIAHIPHDTANYEYMKLETLKQKLNEMNKNK